MNIRVGITTLSIAALMLVGAPARAEVPDVPTCEETVQEHRDRADRLYADLLVSRAEVLRLTVGDVGGDEASIQRAIVAEAAATKSEATNARLRIRIATLRAKLRAR